MHRLLYLFITPLVFITLWGCSDSGKLTNQIAQRAVTQWAGTGNGNVMVMGVLEVPQENLAKADIQFSRFKYPSKDSMFGNTTTETYSGSGVAIFAHYNDGRWILTQIILSKQNIWGPIHWDNVNIAATGTPAQATSLPSFPKSMLYRDARQELTKLGWRPVTLPDAMKCQPGDERCKDYPEMWSCAGTGLAACGFTWKRNDLLIQVIGIGEGDQHVDGVFLCESGNCRH